MNGLCEFETTPDGRTCFCRHCGFVHHGGPCANVHRRCVSPQAGKPQSTVQPCNNCGTPGMPGVLRTLWNFAKATARWAANGARTATAEQYEERQAICAACPRLAGGTRCSACGCYVSYKAARIERPGQSDCPEGRWPVA